MYLVKLTERELGFEPKYDYFISVEDEYSQPKFYRRVGNRLVEKSQCKSAGYIYVNFTSAADEYKTNIVHRVVAKTFLFNNENKPEIDHIDTDKNNNCISNLRWTTRKENCNNELSIQHLSKAKIGKPSPNPDSRKRKVACIDKNTGKVVKEYDSVISVEADGFFDSNVIKCCKGKREVAYGYVWKYID